ncbi:MAG: 2-polyprenyl-3-methyl-5-hydroxy-6-metoxy-1,4-benzoquinol methylase [Planctomycetota bacterium]|jgi:2-polyprenyl-3-methyl-5-hydroxy-6-metoxy-1,4-benzoquinol methylase
MHSFQLTKTVTERFSAIEPHIGAGRVLDVGCVDARRQKGASGERLRKPNHLFRKLIEAGSNVCGVDIDAEGVKELKTQGFEVLCEDACSMKLDECFDTIVAGEIIEHVDNVGLFLANLRAHLKPSGVLMVSTPNPFYAGQAWKIWRHAKPQVHEDHVAWFDPATLSVAMRRAGLEPFDGFWVQPRVSAKIWKSFFRGYFRHSFIILARPKSAND